MSDKSDKLEAEIREIDIKYAAATVEWVGKTARAACGPLNEREVELAVRVHQTRLDAAGKALEFLRALSAHQYAVDCQRGEVPEEAQARVDRADESAVHEARAKLWMNGFRMLIDSEVAAVITQTPRDLVTRDGAADSAVMLCGRNSDIGSRFEAVKTLRQAAEHLLRENLADAIKSGEGVTVVDGEKIIGDDLRAAADELIARIRKRASGGNAPKPQGDA